jgi:Uma2 family endonuclease
LRLVTPSRVGSKKRTIAPRTLRALTKFAENEPQPDVVLIRPREDFYGTGHPQPDDVLLLIEVSEKSLRFDQNVKLPIYARSGIRELWIVDLNGDVIHTFRKPKDKGYMETDVRTRNDSISPEAFSDFSIRVSDLLG